MFSSMQSRYAARKILRQYPRDTSGHVGMPKNSAALFDSAERSESSFFAAPDALSARAASR